MQTSMKAAKVQRYGPPETLWIDTAPVPEPRPNEVLLRVEAAAVTSADARLLSGNFPPGFAFPARMGIGLRGPRRKIPGSVFAGQVERVGSQVTNMAVGDSVAGMTGMRLGAHAEYVSVPPKGLSQIPEGLSWADAAGALFGGSTALHFLRDRAHLQAGQTVLVNGASGSVGTAVAQLAKHFGASVTAVTRGPNHELLKGLGADDLIDYCSSPISDLEDRFDVVFDAVGNLSRSTGLRLAGPEGSVVLAVASLKETVSARGRVIAGPAPERAEDFDLLLALVAAGSFDPVVEVLGGLESLPEAHRRIQSGRKVGNLVVLPPRA